MKTIHLALSSLLLSSLMHAGCGGDTAPADAFTRDANSTGVDASVDAFSATDTPLPTPDAFMSMSTSYTTESRTIDVMGRMRSYVISVPSGSTVGLPLVIALHGDGGSGMGMRASLNLEADIRAVHIYLDAVGGTFEYWSDAGRNNEVNFVSALVANLGAAMMLDESRVFLTGFSGGATMANAVGCRMGARIRGMGIHSGTLYPVDVAGGGQDFTYTGSGGVSCALPATMFVWGEADRTEGVSYAQGQAVRDNYLATQGCAATTTPTSDTPCEAYNTCTRSVVWCGIPGMSHSVWPNAHRALGAFFTSL
jgi:polyhydroxybutyrate depolymerase